MENLEINVADSLNTEEKKIFDKLFSQRYEKLKRKIKGDFRFKLHLKVHRKIGKSKRFIVDAEVMCKPGVFVANVDDWELAKIIHQIFNKLEMQIEHKFHVSEQH